MNVSYTEPLGRAWDRMKRILFRPFQFEAWLVLGFSAFLSELFSGSGSFARSGWKGTLRNTDTAALESARDHVVRLLERPLVLAGLAVALIVFLVLMLVLGWVSARARFVFMDNVATGRAAFVAPWSRTRRLGTSLFLWQAVFSFAWLVPLTALALPLAPVLAGLVRGTPLEVPAVGAVVAGVLVAILLALPLVFVHVLLLEFVVPVMYRYDEPASQAWARFWPLLTSHAGSFIAYAMFLVVLGIATGVAVLAAGVATCCIGLVLVLLPYIGSVVLLPITVAWRALGPEFLAQFGPEWTSLAPLAPATPPPAPAPQPPATPPL